ncbi:MAG TPA: hypothetical protein VFS39_03365 [Nitrospira sp.]|nr:hypothetical protein [Nitrospira sp.]
MAMAHLSSRQPRDPYAGMSEEKRPYIAMQMEQDRRRSRDGGSTHGAQSEGRARSRGAMGHGPEQPVPSEKTLTIENDASYNLDDRNPHEAR